MSHAAAPTPPTHVHEVYQRLAKDHIANRDKPTDRDAIRKAVERLTEPERLTILRVANNDSRNLTLQHHRLLLDGQDPSVVFVVATASLAMVELTACLEECVLGPLKEAPLGTMILQETLTQLSLQAAREAILAPPQ